MQYLFRVRAIITVVQNIHAKTRLTIPGADALSGVYALGELGELGEPRFPLRPPPFSFCYLLFTPLKI
jgi:hypothetical protein